MGYIYSLTNKVNGKKYIGQSQQLDINQRWRAYKTIKKGSIGTVLFRALTKYGVENFKFEVICVCFDDDCNYYEVDYIKRYSSMTPNGYNMQDGGKNPSITCRKKIILSDEQKEKRKGRFKGEKSPNFGKEMSVEQKKKISESLKKFAEKNKGKPRTPRKKTCMRTIEQYDKDNVFVSKYNSLTDAGKSINSSYHSILRYAKEGILYKGFYWRITSETRETKEVPYGLRLGHEALKKKVSQYDLKYNFIASYESISEAARTIKGTNPPIARCADTSDKYKQYKTYKGFIWKFSEQTQHL